MQLHALGMLGWSALATIAAAYLIIGLNASTISRKSVACPIWTAPFSEGNHAALTLATGR
jgi:hypothetical protein